MRRRAQASQRPHAAPSAAEGGGSTDLAAALRLELSAQLPEYMVPSAYVQLERLPLTPNGKVDRGALPAPGAEAVAARAYQAPEGELEAQVAAIWAELLGLERVGRHDDFFALGGHSLLAAQLTTRLNRDLDAALSLRSVFDRPTVARLAEAIDETRGTPAAKR